MSEMILSEPKPLAKKRKAIWLGLLLAATITIAIWAQRPAPAPSDQPSHAKHSASGPSSLAPRGRNDITAPVAAVAKPMPNTAAVTDAYRREADESTNRRATFERLAAIADPSAALAAVHLAEMCALYADETFAATLRRIDATKAPPSTKATQRATAERERTKCVGFTNDMLAKHSALNKFVYDKGDPRGLRYDMPIKASPVPDRIAMAQAAIAMNDPVALEEVGKFFVGRSDVTRNALYDLGNGIAVSTGTIRDAFFLIACGYGIDCSAQSPYIAARCVTAGQCDAVSFEDYLFRYQYTPAEADRVNAARQAIQEGMRTGHWPPGFWDTPHR
jgi:hypothetical protein